MTTFVRILLLSLSLSLAACQEAAQHTEVPTPTSTNSVLPSKQTQDAIVEQLNAAQELGQQRLNDAEKF